MNKSILSHCIVKIFSIVGLVLLLTGCAALDWLEGDKAPPLKGKRVPVFEEHPALSGASKAMDKEPVMVPPASMAVSWPYSTLVPGTLPENIQLTDETKRVSLKVATFVQKQISQTVPVISDNQAFILSCDGSLYYTALKNEGFSYKNVVHLFNKQSPVYYNKRCQNTALASYGGQIYGTIGGAEVFAVDAATKKILWQFDTAGAVHLPPVVTEKDVAVLTTDNVLIVLNRMTGEPKWQQQMIEEEIGVLGQAMPIVDHGVLFVPFSNGVMVAYHMESGQMLWRANLSYSRFHQTGFQFNDVATTPVIKEGVLYVASNAGALFAIRSGTGELLWQAPLEVATNLWVAGNTVFAKNQAHHVIAFNRFNGNIKWDTDLAHNPMLQKMFAKQKGKLITSGLMMVEGKLLVTTSLDTMAVISPITGEVERAVAISATHAAPVVLEGSIYIFCNNHRLTPLSKASILGK